MLRRSVFLAVGCAVAATSHAELVLDQVRTCNRSGGLVTPLVGDALYGIRVDFRATTKPERAYSIRFQMANRSFRFRVTNPKKGNQSAFATFPMPLSGEIPVRVVLDEENELRETNRTNNVFEGGFTPNEPTAALTLSPFRTLKGYQGLRLNFGAAFPGTATLALSRPTDSTGQTLRDRSATRGATVQNVGPFASPIYVLPFGTGNRTMLLEQSFIARVQQITVRRASVANLTWDQYTNNFLTNQLLRQPEGDAIPAENANIRAFVVSILGENYRATMRPWEASQRLFRAVNQRLSADVTATSSPLQALNDNKANAAGFARLYVTALRNAGIGARVASGLREGTNLRHTWVELWLPTLGFLPQDPWDGENLDPTGTYAYCSTTLLDGAARVATERNNTFSIGQAAFDSLLLGGYILSRSTPVPTVTTEAWLRP